MEKQAKTHFKQRLLEEKHKVMDTIGKMKNPSEMGFTDEYSIELSSYDNHPADLGTEVFMMEQEKGLMDKLNNTLYEIETSIETIEKGNYGICTLCGKSINRERLELIPYLKLCIDCAKDEPLIEEKVEFIPNEMLDHSKGNEDSSGFDREDSYQEVARYNRIEKDPSHGTGDLYGVFDEDDSGTVEDVEEISKEYYDDTLK